MARMHGHLVPTRRGILFAPSGSLWSGADEYMRLRVPSAAVWDRDKLSFHNRSVRTYVVRFQGGT